MNKRRRWKAKARRAEERLIRKLQAYIDRCRRARVLDEAFERLRKTLAS